MGNGDWWIALTMDWRTSSPWLWWQWRFGCKSCFFIWCITIEVRLSVAIWEEPWMIVAAIAASFARGMVFFLYLGLSEPKARFT